MNKDLDAINQLIEESGMEIKSSGVSCPVCNYNFLYGETVMRCKKCKTFTHPDCNDFNKVCAMFGCECHEFDVCMFDGVNETEIAIDETLPVVSENNVVMIEVDSELQSYLDEYKEFLRDVAREDLQIQNVRINRFWKKRDLSKGKALVVKNLYNLLNKFGELFRKELEVVANEICLSTKISYFEVLVYIGFWFLLLLFVSFSYSPIPPERIFLGSFILGIVSIFFRLIDLESDVNKERKQFLEHAILESETYLKDCEYLEDRNYAVQEANEKWFKEKNGA